MRGDNTGQGIGYGITDEAPLPAGFGKGCTQSSGDSTIVAEASPLGRRAACPMARDCDPRQTGPCANDLVRVDAKLPERARAGGLDNDVGTVEQGKQGSATFCCGQIDLRAVLALVERGEKSRITVAHGVWAGQALHLYYLRAGKPEKVRSKRSGPKRGQVHDYWRAVRRISALRTDGQSLHCRGIWMLMARGNGHSQRPTLCNKLACRKTGDARGYCLVIVRIESVIAEKSRQQMPVVWSGKVQSDPAIGRWVEVAASTGREEPGNGKAVPDGSFCQQTLARQGCNPG